MEILFWLGVFGASYSYFLYPLLLLLLRKPPLDFASQADLPTLTVIIAARNEASRIRAKLDNILESDYPAGRLDVIVASDASDDGTDTIVQEYAGRGVRLVRADGRRGKEYAQSLAIAQAKSEILVFTDVATHMDAEALRRIVRPFANHKVGAVSSEDRFLNPDGTLAGEGAYVRYEMGLRRLEANVSGLVGLSGSFFAARRDVCGEWDTASPSDFNTALNCVRLGYVAVVAKDAIGYYHNISPATREYQRKYRTVLRGMASLWRHRAVLNPFKHGFFAWQILSHKAMRWAVPWFLPLPLVSAIALPGIFYKSALLLQISFYGLVAAGILSSRLRVFGPVRVAYFFMEVNAAIVHAALAFLMGNRVTMWEPSKR